MSSRILRRAMPGRTVWLLTTALLAALLVPATTIAAAPEGNVAARPPEQADRTYNHFLYLRHNPVDGAAKTDSLVLAKVTPEGFQQRDVFVHRNLHVGWEPICVTDGLLYALKIGDLISIDLATGGSTLICSYGSRPVYDSGRLYLVHRGGLREFDFRQQAYRDVCGVGDHWSPPLALSPDRKRMAFFTGQDNMMSPSSFRLTLVDLAGRESKTVGPTVYSMVFMTGGGDTTDGPPFIWLDEKTILLVRDEPQTRDGAGPTGIFMMGGGPSEPLLATLDVDTGEMTDVMRLPRFTRRILDPYLRPLGSDSVPRIVLGELGQYRIDLKAKQVVEDNTVIGQYGWSRGREPERLLFGQTELFRADSIPEISVSPDGRQVVWLTKRNRTDAELRYFDPKDDSSRVVAEGWFPAVWNGHRRPEERIVLWATAEDLAAAPAEPAEPPAGWEPFPTDPWPKPPGQPQVDTKPQIDEFFSLTLSTDKETYRLHEPVRLIITLGNKTDTALTFEPPSGYEFPVRLSRRSPRSSSALDLIRDTDAPSPEGSSGSGAADVGVSAEELFAQKEVTLQPQESLRFVRLLEVYEAGRHTVEGQFRLSSTTWRGRVDAQPITFGVVPSADTGALLEAQFQRLVALCRREYEESPASCRYYRISYLGPQVVPLLVALLEDSDDPEFRQPMGRALAGIATAEALPYFERLLAGDMEHDQQMVLDALSNMIAQSRSAEEAFALLLSALRHSNPTVRRGAAERLRRIRDPRVAAAMGDVVGDSDMRTSLMAARYLAAYESLDLADWLALAAEEPTRARYVAVRPMIEQLEKEWHLDLGDLPKTTWEALAADAALLAEYKRLLRAWEQWARENPRTSEHFFDDDRENWPEQQPVPKANNPDAAQRIGSLIEQLGDDDFARREAAQQELERIGLPAVATLERAAAHPDPEIASRARIAVASIMRRIEIEREGHREAAAAAVERSDQAAAGGQYLALLALPDPSLKDCRDASRFFEDAEDWAAYAVAREATAREMKRVIAAPIEEFTRPAPETINLDGKERGGPVVEVQTELDGQWSLGKGTAESWTDWLNRKRDRMGPERFDLLLGLGRLYRQRLGRPAKAAGAYAEALADLPLFVDPLDEVIARHWPVRSGELDEAWGTMAGNYLQAMDELSEVQQELGDLDGAVNTRTRELLALFNTGWDYRNGPVNSRARELCELLRMLPADAPLPPLFWLNVLDPERDTVTLDMRKPKGQGVGGELYNPNVVARPGCVFDTLQVTAEVNSHGRSGMLVCYTVFEKHTTLAHLQWDSDGGPSQRITGSFEVPEEAILIRFDALPQDTEDVYVRQVTVKATFRPE